MPWTYQSSSQEFPLAIQEDPWIPEDVYTHLQITVDRSADGPEVTYGTLPPWATNSETLSLEEGIYCLHENQSARDFTWDNDTTAEGSARFRWYDSGSNNHTILEIPGGDGAPGDIVICTQITPWVFHASGDWGLSFGLNSGWTVYEYHLITSFSLVRLMTLTSLQTPSED